MAHLEAQELSLRVQLADVSLENTARKSARARPGSQDKEKRRQAYEEQKQEEAQFAVGKALKKLAKKQVCPGMKVRCGCTALGADTSPLLLPCSWATLRYQRESALPVPSVHALCGPCGRMSVNRDFRLQIRDAVVKGRGCHLWIELCSCVDSYVALTHLIKYEISSPLQFRARVFVLIWKGA